MSILKPNIPLKYVKPDGTTQSEYPLTSIDQVIDEDGIHRLNQTIVRADLSDVEEGQVVLTNADLLENHPASYFATSEGLNTKANKSDVLSLEEIQASTDLTGKIASASALDDTLIKGKFTVIGTFTSTDSGTQAIFSEPLNNFKYFMIRVEQGYGSIVCICPVSFIHISSQFSFSHGISESYGTRGIIRMANTYAEIMQVNVSGWAFSFIEIIGVN